MRDVMTIALLVGLGFGLYWLMKQSRPESQAGDFDSSDAQAKDSESSGSLFSFKESFCKTHPELCSIGSDVIDLTGPPSLLPIHRDWDAWI